MPGGGYAYPAYKQTGDKNAAEKPLFLCLRFTLRAAPAATSRPA